MNAGRVRRGAYVAVWMLLSGLCIVPAALAQTGSITGVVVDSETGETLIGATVTVPGTEMGITTDLDGRFQLGNMEPGTYELVFSYIGYHSKTVQGVEVSPGQVTEINLTLSPEAIGLGEVVVEAEAVRNAEAALLRERQKAAAVSDAISAELIGRSASSTAADALKKVTGATILDGKYINVRGLEGRYVNTQLNGAVLPSADPDRNSVPLDLFPSNLLDNIITTKTFTPDQPGSFTGGNINIGTRAFPDHSTLTFSTSLTYDSQIGFDDVLHASGGLEHIPDVVEGGIPSIASALTNKEAAERLDAASRAFNPGMVPVRQSAPVNQSYSVAYGNRFDVLGGRPLGIVASLSYDQDVTGHDTGTVGQYELTGPVSTNDLLSTEMNLTDVAGGWEELLGGLVNLSFRPHPKHELGVNLIYSRAEETFARMQSGQLPRNLIRGEIFETSVMQQIERELRTLQGRGEHVLFGNRNVRLEWNSTYTQTSQDEPDLRIFSSHRDTTGGETRYIIAPSLYTRPTRYFRDMSESSWSNDFSLAVPIGSATVKIGSSYMMKDRQFRERRFEYGQTTGYTGNPDAFFGNAGLVEGSLEAGAPYEFGNYIQEVTQRGNNYDAEQTVGAGFAMIDMPLFLSNLRFIGGLRAEYTDQFVLNANRNGRIEELDLLPSINLVYALTDNMNARLAYGRTLARPSFREFAPFNSYDFINSVQIIGNPELERTLVNNFDARWEWFMRTGEILAVSAFYKDFSNPIEQMLSPGAVNREITYQNAAEATVAGVEFEARKRLDVLASALSNFQIGGNLTLTHSEVSIDPAELTLIRGKNPDAPATRELQGQSPYVVNLDLGYAHPDAGTNVSVFYNVFGKRLDTVARAGTPDLYEQPRHTLDLVASQRVPFGVEIRVSVKNILGADYEVSQEYKDRTYYTYRYDMGRTISLGLKYTL